MTIGTRVVVTAGRWTGMHGTITDYADFAIDFLEPHDLFEVTWDQPNVLEGLVRREHLMHEPTHVAPIEAGQHTLKAWLDA